ncbi:MAG: hypothetical protein KGY70_02330 [Bacteroidales bacterium]|nr:hypothetical protein [Bacteroidales bacterium]
MKKLIIASFLLLAAFQVHSQYIRLGFQAGRSQFSMEKLKSINKQIQQSFPVETKQISNYPSNWYYQPILLTNVNIIDFGIFYSFQSTGSRISAKDYSGEYKFETDLKSNTFGIHAAIPVVKMRRVELSLYSEVGVISSDLEMKEYLNLMDSTYVEDEYQFHAKNFIFEPGLNLTYYPFDFLGITFNAGYSLLFGDNAYFSDELDTPLYYSTPQEQHEVKPEWSGLRLGLTVYVRILQY